MLEGRKCGFPVGTHTHLNKNLAQGDERRADLRQEQAADEEISLVVPEELWNKREKTQP